jgi:dUTPase
MEENNVPKFKFAIKEGLSDIYLPTRGTEKSTGWDVRSADRLIIRAGEYAKIPLGFRLFCPLGWWMELRPRSSSFAKKNLHALHGVIDEDYEGQCIFACQYIPPLRIEAELDEPYGSGYKINGVITKYVAEDLIIQEGEAIGQIIPIKRQEMIVERVSNEEYEKLCKERSASRGAGGFGSTSK